MNRRDFLFGSTAAATAGSLSLARSAHAAGSDQIKIGLVGCGGRGTGAAANCLSVPDNIKLVAVADAFEDRAAGALGQLKRKFGEKVDVSQDRVFTGFDAYKSVLQADIDMVLLVTPPGFRPMQYRAAIEAGKHVFMEKPCCVDAPGFRSLMETNKMADCKNLKVAVGLNTRHTLRAVETVKRVHDGAIGEPMLLRAYCNNAGVWVRPRQPGQTEMQYQMGNRYYCNWRCGDLIVEQTVHLIDAANWLKDAVPIEANGMGGREVRKGKDHGQIFDHHFVEYTYADGAKMYCQARHIRGCFSLSSAMAHGPKGEANCRGTITGENAWTCEDPSPSGHQQEHDDLIAALRKDQPYNEGYYGATSSMTAVLGRMATYSGQIVRFEDAVANGPNEGPERFAFDADPPVLPDPQGNYAVPMPGQFKPY